MCSHRESFVSHTSCSVTGGKDRDGKRGKLREMRSKDLVILGLSITTEQVNHSFPGKASFVTKYMKSESMSSEDEMVGN